MLTLRPHGAGSAPFLPLFQVFLSAEAWQGGLFSLCQTSELFVFTLQIL